MNGKWMAKLTSTASGRRVMPVVITPGHEVGLEPARAWTEVRVAERGVKRNEDEVPGHRALREAEQRHWYEDQAARDEDVDEVRTRTGDPVHRLDGVMDRMEAPQERDLVKRQMRCVLREVRNDDGHRQMHP